MILIENQTYSGERPLYESRNIAIHNVTIGEGESGLKECRHIQARHCNFEGMYILWEGQHIECRDCLFTKNSRASLWYVHHLQMTGCRINSVKPLREVRDFTISDLTVKNGAEAFWFCRKGNIGNLKMEKAEYAFFQSDKITINQLNLQGKYTFQYARNIEIRDSVLDTKDAFWMSENCTIYDSQVKGEYLGWYSRNLRLVRCHISGTQPLCYCRNLILEDCTFAPDADLAFEYSTVQATVRSAITSIKNPTSGSIVCSRCDNIILNEHQKSPANCQIQITEAEA